MTRKDLAGVIFAVVVGSGVAVVTPIVASGHGNGKGNGECAVGSQSVPVGTHSHPCNTPRGCAVGNPHVVGDVSRACTAPRGCAVGNPHVVGDASKPCPTPPGHGPKAGKASAASSNTTTSPQETGPPTQHGHRGH